jgi:hypothetical protein
LKRSRNDLINSIQIKVLPSETIQKDYFLSNLTKEGFIEFLDFQLEKKGKTKISISIAISSDGQAVSIPKAPFGGFWCAKKVNSVTLGNFINNLQTELKLLGVKHLKITQAPKPYEPYSDLINYLLFKFEFKQTKILSHHSFIGSNSIKKYLRNEEPKIQKKLQNSGLTISHGSITSFEFLKQIKLWNSRKGYHVGIDENQLINQVSEFPDRYFLIQLDSQEGAVGYALAVKLTANSIYYFLSAIDSSRKIKNGGDFLLYELFLLAKEQKVDFIDLGSSDTESGANHSLMFFKSRFSNDISNKITWEKSLNENF